jgi:hypothetical protein
MQHGHLSSLIIFVAACGGSQKPVSSADTASLDNGPSSRSEAPAASDTPPADTASTAPADGTSSAGGSSSAGASPAAAPESMHPTPSVTGSVDGKPFAPKLAHVVGRMRKDGRVLISVDERTECATPGDASKPDDAALTILVPWEDGYKIDLSALKRGGKKKPGEIAFSRANPAGKMEIWSSFKPSGRVTIVKAPMDKDAVGKMKIDLQSGDYMLAGDLDVQVCVAPK